MSQQDLPLEDAEKYEKRQRQFRESKRRQRERERAQKLTGTHHEQVVEKTIPMTLSTAKLLAALAEAEGLTQGALVERLATALAKRKHKDLYQRYQRAYW